jgi:hypothetical protein
VTANVPQARPVFLTTITSHIIGGFMATSLVISYRGRAHLFFIALRVVRVYSDQVIERQALANCPLYKNQSSIVI